MNLQNKTIHKTILNIVLVYLTTTILLIVALATIYYNFQKKELFSLTQSKTNIEANNIIQQLQKLHQDYQYGDIILYPSSDEFRSSLYDIDQKPIYQEFVVKNIDLTKKYWTFKDNLYFVYKVQPYYLGVAYLVIQKDQELLIYNMQKNIIIAMMIIIVVLTLTSFILVKILLRPLSNNLILLDRFIKDTTHELNLPISAILGNIETLDYSTIGQNNLKKIDRIKIASSTISNIYDDLSFLLLQNHRHSKDLNLDISYILKQRIEYFTPMANAQRLKFQVDIANNIILIIDQVKIERLFDNLISNAIKYSQPNTTIQIKLDQNMFSIEDQGCGMTKEQINEIFIRYKRFNNTVGGFGIGYSIIKTITDQYNIKINIISNIDQGTKVELLWSK